MIFVVSEKVAEPESPLLEDVIPAPEPESPFTLLDETSIDELDSSTALLSVFSGPEPLESSPQATRRANKDAKNASKNFGRFISSFFLCPYQIMDSWVQNKKRMNKVFLNPPYNDQSPFLK